MKIYFPKFRARVAGFLYVLLAINVGNLQSLPGDRSIVNVQERGAVGDGLADDGAAIRRAVAEITANHGGTLYFPPGSYRCARDRAFGDGIRLEKVSNVTIEFAPEAELVMDNLNPVSAKGDQGNGFLLIGPAQNIRLSGVKIRWEKRPAKRSQGDGFRFLGFPAAEKTISGIVLANCRIENAPQAGAIFMGCANVHVLNFQAQSTLADGLHFNACQNVSVDGYRAINTGDDGLAFVTYAPEAKVNPAKGPFSVTALGDWSNTDSTATNLEIEGGKANGVRICGGKNISLSKVHVQNKSAGIIIDSGKKDRPQVGWSCHASRGISIDGLTAENCEIGLLVVNHNVPPSDPPLWWHFDVTAANLQVETSRRFGLCLIRCAGIKFDKLSSGRSELHQEETQVFEAASQPDLLPAGSVTPATFSAVASEVSKAK